MRPEKRAVYGTGTTYWRNNTAISQIIHTVTINGKAYSKRVTGSGNTEAKAVRKRNENAKKWENQLKEKLLKEEMDAEDIESEKEKSTEEELKGPTMNDVWDMCILYKDTTVQLPTSDNYGMYYDGYIRTSSLGNTRIREITEEQLWEFYLDIRVNGRKRIRKDARGEKLPAKPLSITTMNHIRFVVNSTFLYAVSKKILIVNPHVNIKPFKAGTAIMTDFEEFDLDADSDEKDALQRVIPLEDLKRILDYACTHSRLANLFAWAVNSGMREGECLGIMREQALPEANYVFVKKSLTYVKNRRKPELKGTVPKLKKPKNGKERKIPYNKNLKDIYQRQLRQIEEEKEKAGDSYQDKGLLFPDEYGNFLRPWKVLDEFQRILAALGMEKRKFHDFRHTFVSLLIKISQSKGDGVSVLDVSQIVGHSDPTVTLKVYGGLFPDSTEKAMSYLNDCDEISLKINA